MSEKKVKHTRATRLKEYHEKYPYTDNCNLDHRVMGTTLNSPGCRHNTSQRLAMLSAQVPQALNIVGGERQLVFTGFDSNIKKYKFNDTKQKQDISIVAVIPRIMNTGFVNKIKTNPKSTVIFIGKDGKAGYFDVNNFEELSDGFGYMNKKLNTNLLFPNVVVPKNTSFTEPPGNDELGCNATIAMMRSPYTAEDSFAISESFAKKNQTFGLSKAYMLISKNQIPDNIYGDEDEHKFIPDIGEQVGPDGILCCIKNTKEEAILDDLNTKEYSEKDYLHDILYKVPPGATIVNIETYCDQKFNKNKSRHFDQIRKYNDRRKRYWQSIVEIYERFRQDRIEFSNELHTLFTTALSLTPIHTKKQGQLQYKNKPIEYIYVEITYSWTQEVQRGFKFTGTEGGKGTICKILPDEYMPINEYGERADMIVDPITVINRMNLSQWYVMTLNHVSSCIIRDINTGKIPDPYEYIMRYLSNINKNYVDLLKKRFGNRKHDFVKLCLEEGIHINYTPYINFTEKDLKRVFEEFGHPHTRVSFLHEKSDGTVETVITEKPIPMGKKYIMLLCKIPHVSSSGIGRVSQFMVPIQSSSVDKTLQKRSAIRNTPIKFGEDEVRNMIMSCGVEVTARTLCMYGCSPEATYKLMIELLTAKEPSNIRRVNITTGDCIRNNKYIKLQRSMMAITGVDISE